VGALIANRTTKDRRLYPAFKENVEAILPWTGVLKRGIVIEGLLRFMDQQRRNNFSFFEKRAEERGVSQWVSMFEAFGQVSDSELMMVNLDVLDTYDAQQFPPRRLNFTLYNPTTETRSAVLTIPPSQGAKVGWSQHFTQSCAAPYRPD
jgi:hypothetical protein